MSSSSKPITIAKNKSVRPVVKFASWIYTHEKSNGLLYAVEKAMDELNYEGDEFIDDIADMVVKDIEADNAFTDTEMKQLREAQKQMDRIVLKNSFQKYSIKSDDWNPSSPPKRNDHWEKVLDVIDTLDKRCCSQQQT
jgi:hypothetical protein